jgi:NAD(P)-dependent dehydrogenase (short-subunit alcohol dehydrogenase family)
VFYGFPATYLVKVHLLAPGTHGNAGQANYATAKAGVVGLTKTVAKGARLEGRIQGIKNRLAALGQHAQGHGSLHASSQTPAQICSRTGMLSAALLTNLNCPAPATEWGPFGVRCNCIAFGLIDTR